MPELGSYGSVRGARDNSGTYRERHLLRLSSPQFDPKRTDIESNRLSPRLFSVWLTGAHNLSAVMFPHSIRRKNIAEPRPNNHLRYRHPIRQLEQYLCYARCKHPSHPPNSTTSPFPPTNVAQIIC